MGPVRVGVARAFVALYRAAARSRAKGFSVLARAAFASFGADSVIQPPVRLVGEERISVGDRVFIAAGSWLQVLTEDDPSATLEIGDGVSIAGYCVISAAHRIRLGSDVLLARNVYISDHIHAYDDTSRPVLGQGVAKIAPVEIEDGAWLGQNVVVCPGVRIGRGAVIGANSVVTESVPDHSLAVGAPARVVRRFAEAAHAVT